MSATTSLEEPSSMGMEERAGSNGGDGSVNGSGVARRGGSALGVESLGEALAGVSLGGTTRSPTGSAFPNFSLSGNNGGGEGADPGNVTGKSGGEGTGGNGTSATSSTQEPSSGWGNFADVSIAAESAFANGTPGNHGHHSTVDPSPRDGGTGGTDHSESLQLFLSRDPSQSLGDDVFTLSHPNLASLATGAGQHDTNKNNGNNRAGTNASSAFRLNGHSLVTGIGVRPNSNKASNSNNGNNNHKNNNGSGGNNSNGHNRGSAGNGEGARTESPASAVTAGTTSTTRSASSYNLGNGAVGAGGGVLSSAAGSIQAFPPYDAPSPSPHLGVPDYSTTFINGGPPPPSSPAYNLTNGSIASPYNTKNNKSSYHVHQQLHSHHGNPNDFMAAGLPPPLVDPAPAQPGQVLYMAVQSPDGRGQVLQPVQMVQLPGKQMAYVVAGPAGMPPPDAAHATLDPYGNGPVVPLLGAIGTPDMHQSRSLTGSSNGGGVGVDRGITGGGSGYSVSPPVVTEMGRSYSESRSSSQDASAEYPRSNGSASAGGQFQADPAIASLYTSPQRPPLDALLGQIRRLSRDQVGCRLVQQALDEEGSMAASLILQEGLPFWGEAMVDPFGNYLFQKILEKVTPEERIMLVRSVSTRLVNASLNLHGTRSVQKVVELCAADEQACTLKSETGESAADILTEALSPAAARLCIDSHGNHVIQRIILKLGSKHSEFVFDAVAASVGDVARHRHGCCVIQRCLDSAPSEARSHLVHRIVEKALELMQDAYGNYVVQYVLDVCSDEDVHAVCESVVGKVNLLAIQKFSSNVMEKCLERCSERVKECYMKEMSDHERVRELMMDPFGNYVVQRALSVATHAQAIRLVEAMRPHLVTTTAPGMGGGGGLRNGGVRNTAGGRRIIAKICRRFPNFSLTPGEQDLYRRNHHHHHHPGTGAAVASPMSGGGNHHHHQHHLHQHHGSPHEELYSRNKGRYQQMNNAGQNMSPGGHPLTAAATGQPPSYAAVGGPPLHQGHPSSYLRSPVTPDVGGLRGGAVYGASPPPQATAAGNSYYNPLGLRGGPLGSVGAAVAPPYYDPFNTNDGGRMDGSIGGNYM